MFLTKFVIKFYIFLNNIAQIRPLVQLPIIENNEISITETVIRNTVNDLFAAFKISDIKSRTRIEEFSTIHNFFVSITLTDCENFNKISRLSTVNNIDNSTKYFISQINAVVNEDDKSTRGNDDENNIYVEIYLEKFINRLKLLKDVYGFHKKTGTSSDILKYINNNKKAAINVMKDDINSTEINDEPVDEGELLHDKSWRPFSARRLYRGTRTSIKRFPFMASIHFFNNFQCSGSIIKNDLVITSSSCLQIAWNNRFFRENPTFLSVRIGCDYFKYCGAVIPVQEIYFHPLYDPKTLKHNLAIMRLKFKINFANSHRHVINIDYDKNTWEFPSNSKVTVVGWGAKDYTNVVSNIFNNKLSYAELEYFLLEDCQNYYTKEFVSKYNFCAGFYTRGGGACSHDAGGPAILNSVLIGVISFGSPDCGAPGVPTVFTKLGYYSDWIEDIASQNLFRVRSTRAVPKPKQIFTKKPTIQNLRINPIQLTKPKPSWKREDMLRIPMIQQNPAFEDFLTTVFENEETKDNINGNNIRMETKISTDETLYSKLDHVKVIMEIVQKNTYDKNKIAVGHKDNVSESKHISENNTDSSLDSSSIDAIEGISIEDVIKSLKIVNKTYNSLAEFITTAKIKGISYKGNAENDEIAGKIQGRTYKAITKQPINGATAGPKFNTTVTDKPIEIPKDFSFKPEKILIETPTKTPNMDEILKNVTYEEKILEENIMSFIKNLDLDKNVITQDSSAIGNNTAVTISLDYSGTQLKEPSTQKLEVPRPDDRVENSSVQKSVPNSIFISNENSDDNESEQGLSIM